MQYLYFCFLSVCAHSDVLSYGWSANCWKCYFLIHSIKKIFHGGKWPNLRKYISFNSRFKLCSVAVFCAHLVFHCFSYSFSSSPLAAKYNGELYNKRRLMVEMPAKGLPLQPMGNSRPSMASMGNMSSVTPQMTTNPMASNPMSANPINHVMAPMTSMTPMTSLTPMTSMTPMTSLTPMTSMTPMTSLGPLTPEPVATYVTEMPSISSVSTLPTERHIAAGGGGGHKPNGQKPKVSHGHTAHSSHSSHSSHTHLHSHSSKPPGLGATSLAHMAGTMPGGTSLGISRAAETVIGHGSATMGRPLAYSSNTIASSHAMGLGLKGWDGTETVGRRKTYGHKRPQCTILEPNQLHSTRGHSHSQHFLPTQPYFVTNSKTEVTVWERKTRRNKKRGTGCMWSGDTSNLWVEIQYQLLRCSNVQIFTCVCV